MTRGTPQSRYDILFAYPQESLTLHADGRLLDAQGVARDGRFLDALDAAWRQVRVPRDEADELPFHGGWLLLLAYELVGEIEPTPAAAVRPSRCPPRWRCVAPPP